VPFAQLLDPRTGRTSVRLVDVNTTRYAIARRYMLRLRRDDFDHEDRIERLAAAGRMTPERFREEFEYLVADEPPALRLMEAGLPD
jgi:6-phosphofructokinase 1